MSNPLAIAAATATLQKMLSTGVTVGLPPNVVTTFNLGNTQVTTKPPDKARGANDNFNQINLFLYQTTPNAALGNMDMPRQVRPGETGQPPAALNLHYLVTAIGQNDDDTRAHILMGQVVRIFHDHAVLNPAEIQAALNGNDLHEQVERVRITPQPLSAEEMSKLWTTFQTPYRVSAAYQVSVVLIESAQPLRAPLPVLTRGKDDAGVQVQTGLIPPNPALEEIDLPAHHFSAQLGELLALKGVHLDGDTVAVHFRHPRLSEALVRPSEAGSTAAEVRVKVPDVADDPQAPADWPPGIYAVSVAVTTGGETRTTNELALSLGPRIESVNPTNHAPGDFTLALTCRPQIRPEQRVVLLFGSREIPAKPFTVPANPSAPSSLSFDIQGATTGTYYLRLRVDGVDSQLVQVTGTPPQASYDPALKVEIS